MAASSSSLEFTYEAFNTYRHEIKQNDIVILIVTNMGSHWFFRENPSKTYWMIMDKDPEMRERIETYLTHLENKELKELYLKNFLYNLQYLTKKLSLHTIVLSTFKHGNESLEKIDLPLLNIARDNLYNVSVNEFEDGVTDPFKFFRRGVDFRISHLTHSNHTVLANKIVTSIKEKTPLTLATEFKKGIITKNALNDNSFYDKEIFGINIIDQFRDILNLD